MMLSAMSATDVAFTMAGLMQAVFAVVWLLGSWLIGDTRRAAVHWAGHAALSALSFALLATALNTPGRLPAEIVRAAGNLVGVIALLTLHRGIRLFVGRPVGLRIYGVALAVVLVAAGIGIAPDGGRVRVIVTSSVLALFALAMCRDLIVHARDDLRLRWPAGLGITMIFAAAGFAFRAGRAALNPDSVGSEMIRDSALNVGSAFAYTVLMLAFHATLLGLVAARFTAQLRHRSRHDGLTGLLDRRAIDEALQAQIQRSRRTGETFSVLMLDLDHFKAINDRFGHAAGDRALKHVAALLREVLREIDRLGRIGGEEFLAMMPGATLDTAAPVAERVRERLAASPVVLESNPVAISVSIGLAQWIPPDEEAWRLVGRADRALYAAKAQGRDRVVAASAGQEPLPVTAW
jgi:diguanylate cyclase (GGDEF)-like protein